MLMALRRKEKIAIARSDAGERLDRVLAARTAHSRSRLKGLILDGKVAIGPRTIRDPSYRVNAGDTISLSVPPPEPAETKPEDIPLNIIFEDKEIIVIEKPAGLVVHPAAGHGSGTLVNALIAHCGDSLSGIGGVKRPGIVHRLDKDTSGLLVVAKNDRAHKALAAQFLHREVKKTYLALVHGWLPKPQGTINTPISRDLNRRERMTTKRADGRTAITHWKVLKAMEGKHGKFSLLEVKIETGRTHQIRAHLSSIGHPVAGDALYGAPRALPGYVGTASGAASLGRHYLHSFALQFRHPISSKPLSFEQPLPAELKEFLDRVGD